MTLRHRVHRVLYVPLDDRPVNLQMPPLLAGIVDYDMATPPRHLLGSYHTAGQPEPIWEWLLARAGDHVDCVILSLDMLLYGGLIASREPTVPVEIARQRLEMLAQVREAFPGASLFASTTITRLDVAINEEDRSAYGEAFSLFTRLADDPMRLEEVEALVGDLPQRLVEEYRQVRKRNHEMNLAALDQVAAGRLDYLLISQDDAAPEGFHVSEQAALRQRIAEADIEDRVVICAGADESGSTLLSHFVHEHMEETPKVAVRYFDPEGADRVAPYEDRTFAANLGQQARAAGVELVEEEKDADMVLVVSPPVRGPEAAAGDTERPEQLREFAREVTELARRRGVAICDAAFPNGAENAFLEALQAEGLEWPRVLAFSGWNTAGNAAGSALAHGSVRLIGLRDKAAFDLAQLVATISPMRYFELFNSLISAERAHLQLLLTRLVDDWLYQSRIRPLIRERLETLIGSFRLDLTQLYPRAQQMVSEALTEAVGNLWVDEFLGKRAVDVGPPSDRSGMVLAELQDTQVTLPWRRLYEVELQLTLGLELVASAEIVVG